MQTYKSVLIETSIAATLSLAVAALFAPSDLGLGSLYPHPVWLAVAVVAARYGSRGLSVSLPFVWCALTLAALAMRIGPSEVLARTSSGADLGALIGVVLVGAVASIHLRRHDVTHQALATLKERCAADRAAVKELRDAAVVLRSRADHLETSLTFLRDVATRLEGADPVAAAQAALELAVARIGARAGTAQVVQRDGSCKGVASVGSWAPDAPPSDKPGDQTVATALRNGRPTRAFDLSDVSVADSDLAAPILDASGNVRGVLALRGVPHGGANVVALHDLALIAAWCGKGFARAHATGPTVVELVADHADHAELAEFAERAELAETVPRSISQLNV